MKDVLKLALSCIKSSTEYKRGNATFVEAAEDVEQALAAPVQEPVQVWQAEGYDALMKEMQMVKARNIRQYAEIERLSALVRAQQITIDKLEQALAAPVQEPVAWMVYTQDGKSVYVTDNPTDIQEGQRALPLYTTPPAAQPAPVQEPVAWLHPANATCVTTDPTAYARGVPLYTTPPAAPDLQAELDATNRQVEILSDALAESRREVAALKAVQEPVAIDGNTSDGYHTFNELYEFRKAYNAALFNEWAAGGKCSVHKSWRHHDGELCFGGGWFIVVAVLPEGQISNHYEAKDWDLFAVPETERALFEFDDHTGSDVVARLKAYTTPPAARRKPLTDAQLLYAYNSLPSWDWDLEKLSPHLKKFARAIEAAHGIKENT